MGALVGALEGQTVGGVEGLVLGAGERVGDCVGDMEAVGPSVGLVLGETDGRSLRVAGSRIQKSVRADILSPPTHPGTATLESRSKHIRPSPQSPGFIVRDVMCVKQYWLMCSLYRILKIKHNLHFLDLPLSSQSP